MSKKLTVLGALLLLILTSQYAKADTVDSGNSLYLSTNMPGLTFDRVYDAITGFSLSVSKPDQQDAPTAKIKTAKAVKTYLVMATGYSSTPDQTDDTPFITAKGTYVRDGIVAANFLPFGTVIRIPDLFGNKTFVVEDRMNRRYWYNVDVWFPERGLAKTFGAQRVKIEIVATNS